MILEFFPYDLEFIFVGKNVDMTQFNRFVQIMVLIFMFERYDQMYLI